MIVYLPITKKYRLSAYYQQLMIYSILMSLLNHVLNSGHRNETESSGQNKSHNGHCYVGYTDNDNSRNWNKCLLSRFMFFKNFTTRFLCSTLTTVHCTENVVIGPTSGPSQRARSGLKMTVNTEREKNKSSMPKKHNFLYQNKKCIIFHAKNIYYFL